MSIKRKLVVTFLAAASLVVLVGLVGIRSTSTVSQLFDEIADETAPGLIALGQIKSASLRMLVESMSYSLILSEKRHVTQSSAEKELGEEEEFEQARDALEYWTSQYEIVAHTSSEQAYVTSISRAGRRIHTLGRQLIALKRDGVIGNDIQDKHAELDHAEQEFLAIIDEVIGAEMAELERRDRDADRSVIIFTRLTAAVTIVGFFIAGCLGLIIGRSISRPVLRLTEATKKIGKGELLTSIDVESRDEIGNLAAYFNRMARDLYQSAEDLKLSNEYTDNIIRSMVDVLIVLNPDTTIRMVNSSALELLGYKEADLIGRPIIGLLDTDVEDQGRPFGEVDGLLKQGSMRNVEMTFIANGGRKISMLLSGSVMRTSYGETQGAILIARDITERKRLERRQLQSNKMEALGTLAGGIAHDFNNILTAISGYAELGLTRTTMGSKDRRNLASISKAAERASALVRQILTFSRMDTTDLKPLFLSSVIPEVIQMFRASTPSNIEIVDLIKPGCPPILGNATQIHQVLLNLCTNALHALKEGTGRIEVVLEEAADLPAPFGDKKGRYLKVAITDTGCGIDPVVQEKMFDPFFTTKEVGKGTGLGLAVVHGIVTKHEGFVDIDSELGRGTTFSVYFPAVETSLADDVVDPLSLRMGQGRLLIVEDEPEIRELYTQFFPQQGYQVTLCRDGVEAWEVFNETSSDFDLVLTDQAMPRMTGKQLSKKILEVRPDIPIVLVTGFSSEIKEDDGDLDIRVYLRKPFSLTALQNTIETCLNSSNKTALQM